MLMFVTIMIEMTNTEINPIIIKQQEELFCKCFLCNWFWIIRFDALEDIKLFRHISEEEPWN